MWVRLGMAVVKLLLAFGRGLPARCMVQTPFGPLTHSQILVEHVIRVTKPRGKGKPLRGIYRATESHQMQACP